MLVVRGIFIVLTSLYNNHIIALGAARRMVYSETVKDVLAVVAIVVAIPFGIGWLVGGQVIASFVYFVYAIWLTSSTTGYCAWNMLRELLPYLAISVVALVPVLLLPMVLSQPAFLLVAQLLSFAVVYVAANAILHSRIQQEVAAYIFNRKK